MTLDNIDVNATIRNVRQLLAEETYLSPALRSTLPPGDYQDIGYDRSQVFEIDIRRVVTEYRAQILQDSTGHRYTAPFPAEMTMAVQYGNGVKAQAVNLS